MQVGFDLLGDLWISWEPGLQVFLKNLLDADWSVCAGNWMWISSSAFEQVRILSGKPNTTCGDWWARTNQDSIPACPQVLNCTTCIDPSFYGRRADPWGEYIKRFVPSLAKMPVEYIYEPWKAPLSVQEKAGCVLGKDYPHRIVDHEVASRENAKKMIELKESLLRRLCHVSRQ